MIYLLVFFFGLGLVAGASLPDIGSNEMSATSQNIAAWSNRQLFEAIECHTDDELAAQSELSLRDIVGRGLTAAEAAKYRAELMARHADMDETAGIAA